MLGVQEFRFNDRRPIFKALKDENTFRNFKLAFDTLVWPNDADLAPEFLYFQTFKEDKNLYEQFEKWGYIN